MERTTLGGGEHRDLVGVAHGGEPVGDGDRRAAEGMRPSALADALHVAPRSATEVADALEQRGWLRRSPDPTDRRATILALTDAGRELVAAIDDVRRRASEQVLDVLSPAQRRTLHEILTVVVGEDQ